MFPANVLRQVCPGSRIIHKIIHNVTFIQDRLITSKDHASVQISIADVDANGRALGTSSTFALCGQVRSQGESDDSINRLATKAGRTLSILSFSWIESLLTDEHFSVLRSVWSASK